MKHTWDGFFTNCDKNLINKRLRIVHKPIKNGQIFINNQVYIDFQSNDYLGLSKNISLIEAAHNGLEVYGVGSTGAASLSGYTEEHFLLQQEIANWLEYDNCLLFNSGYQMNFSLFQQLVNSNVHIWLDHNCHASHIDGVLLSRARFTRFHSENIDSMYQQISSSDKLQLIITEGIYSMDGSNCSLTQLITLKQTLPDKILLIIDDAHSIGCFGSNGRGTLEVINHIYTKCDILLGTFGKSFGSHGGFLCANEMIVNYLQHSVRSQIFSTNLPPAIIAASRAALEIIDSDKGYSLRMALKHKIKYFQEYSNLNGITLSQPQKNFSAIQLICFENQEVVDKIYQFMFENNILVSKIKYPTVPKNQPRIRISISINHSIDDIKCLLDNLKIAIAQYSSHSHSIMS